MGSNPTILNIKNYNLLKQIKIKYDKNINSVEEKVYKVLNLNDDQRMFFIEKVISQILEDSINEFIATDLEIRNCYNSWVTKNLDSFYNLELSFLFLTEIQTKKILPRTKDHFLRIKIIKANIIISSLLRIEGVYLYTKLKNSHCPQELKNKIKFTKGYLVCFQPDLVDILKNVNIVEKK